MRKLKWILVIILALTLTFGFHLSSDAASTTSYTMTINAKGRYVRTQDAYLPDKTIVNMGLSSPQDMMFGDNDLLYIADTGNRRIVVYNTVTSTIDQEITHDDFGQPKGVFVSDRGVYVADSTANTVFWFDHLGNYIRQFDRPTTPSYADPNYNPNKVVVDNRGNVYIYGEGVKDGIIQLSNTGEFLGYFTSNKVQLSIVQQIYKLIFTEEQFEDFASRDPQSFSSLFIDKNSMIYTTTMGTFMNAIKKHNTQGGNIFANSRTIAREDTRDIYVDDQGIIYAAMEQGTIFIYTADGDFIFNFGASNFIEGQVNPDISGLFTKLASLAVDSKGGIWALDDRKNFVQSFKPTDYALQIYSALNLYNNRQYDESIAVWNEVLRLNQMSVIAHDNIAKTYLQQERYEEAMHHFELAGNRVGYSDAYWEVRNMGIQTALGVVLVLVVVLFVLSKTLSIVNHKTGKITLWMTPVRKFFDRKLLKDIFYIFRVMRHPMDSFYEIKKGHKATLTSAIILYFALFLVYLNYSINKGFIYQFIAAEDMDLSAIIIGFFSITLVLMISNYLDTSIHDGIGGMKQIFIMFIYAMGPLFIALVSTTILSYVLTYNEVFFLNIIMMIGFGWSFINVFLGITEIHDYSGKQAIKSILMTVLFTVIIAVVIIILVMMWEQLYLFLEALIKEAIRNVTQ
ncbi:MAG: YIP1 family protein [Acholeplasmataceae bacterium]|jgi:tetratricopeptide (TPR) repeat protein|nr:YIP1 family protein [Acholeplasmataceae bacterium]